MSVLRYRCECGRWIATEPDLGSVVCCPFCGSISGEWIDIAAAEEAKREGRQTMSYKIGDKVVWKTGPSRAAVGVLTDGPFTVQRIGLANQAKEWGPAWVVDFHFTPSTPGVLFAVKHCPAQLLPESVLRHVKEWQPCPGEHRPIVEGDPAQGWEKQEP